jgi:hypothetical protein
MDGATRLAQNRADVPREKGVVVPRNMVVVPLHDAGAVQNGLGFEGVSAWRGRGGEEEVEHSH